MVEGDDVAGDGGRVAVIKVSVKGNWMVPETQKAAAQSVTDLLATKQPASADVFRATWPPT